MPVWEHPAWNPLSERLKELNPGLNVISVNQNLCEDNASELGLAS